MLNSERRSISTHTMRKDLKGFRLSSCVALRKPLISEANLKKRLQFAGEDKDWTLEQWKKRSCGLMSPDLPCSRVMGASGSEGRLMK